jgi:ketosteroid isomerase-like protein/quercetin dioxygenase-like cupin family protein
MYRWMYVLGLGALLSGACGTSVNVEQERTALMARDRQWSDTTKDVDTFVSYFAADAGIYAPGEPVTRGSDAIRKAFTAMAASPGFALSWTPSSATVASSGDVGYTTGAYQLTMGGTTDTGKYVTVWKRQGGAGEWMVAEDIFNSDAGPAALPHAIVAPNTIKWGDPPPALPAGARVAVVSGDPTKAGPFVLRAQVPAGYRVMPHFHPTAEHLTVLSGTIALGMGDTWNEAGMTTLAAGGFATMPADMRHSFLARSAATFQVHGNGPFVLTYVNAADDPRNKK